ncbi:uncharacterized protein N7482_010280 [Penicillium canariense]|uniref:Uncharacterized protein n=1 Tax=Penicillium canariense TaxID=189055 RepID=A0A9W9LE64_9EURO|nr:uncharacterized protein N7482_010280 [Penicillium canariense]KAJ5151028.1 hypothetical protein N7482_010280 [Penicillium canariense]
MEELEHCSGDENAQADVSRLMIYCQLTAGILSAITAPNLGSLSETIGPKPALSCSTIGVLLCNAMMLLILQHPDFIDLRWVLIGYAIEGLGGIGVAVLHDGPIETARARSFTPLHAGMHFLVASMNSFEGVYWVSFCAYLPLTLAFIFILP